MTWSQTGYWKDSITLFEHVLQLNPENEPALGNLGSAFLKKGEPLKAIPHIEQALRIRQSSDACYNLGMAYSQLNDNEKALKYFMLALQINSNDIGSYNSIGITLEGMGKADEAVVYFKEALKRAPQQIDAYVNLGNVMLRTGRMDEAVLYYTEALRRDPGCPEVYNGLGVIAASRKDFPRAREYFQQALRLRPDYTEASMNLQKTLSPTVSEDPPARKLMKMIESDPRNQDLYVKLAKLQLHAGDAQASIDNFRKAISLKRDSVEARYGLIMALSRKQDYDQALKVMQEIRSLQPDKPETYYNLACIYAKKNDTGESVKSLKKAIDMGFNNWDLIKKDPDLENARGTTAMNELLKNH
jgi:protein O-GlcNAc transferase